MRRTLFFTHVETFPWYQVTALDDPKCHPIYQYVLYPVPSPKLLSVSLYIQVSYREFWDRALHNCKMNLNTIMSKVPHASSTSPHESQFPSI